MSKKLTDYFFKRKDKVSSATPTEQTASINDSSPVNNDANMLDVNNPTVNKQDRSCQASWFIKYPSLHYDERFVHFLVSMLLGESHN